MLLLKIQPCSHGGAVREMCCSGLLYVLIPFLLSGIYIPEDDVSAPERFRGIGVRIEDDVVITEDAPLILSADCPKEIYHIEQICGRSS